MVHCARARTEFLFFQLISHSVFCEVSEFLKLSLFCTIVALATQSVCVPTKILESGMIPACLIEN